MHIHIYLGFARRKHREPCRKVVSLLMSMRVDKFYERRIVWDKLLADITSEPYGHISYEAIRAVGFTENLATAHPLRTIGRFSNICHFQHCFV